MHYRHCGILEYRNLILVSVIGLLLVSSFSIVIVNASTSIIPVETNGSAQVYPAISGNIIVWQDHRYSTLIYRRYLSSGIAVSLVSDPSSQYRPDISGDIVVWEETISGIYYLNMCYLSSNVITDIASSNYPLRNPAISGELIVWEKLDCCTPHVFMSSDSYGGVAVDNYDPSQSTLPAQSNPDVSGTIIVWEDYRQGDSCIYMRDISKEDLGQPIQKRPYQYNPAISNNIVVWDEFGGTDQDIYMFDLLTGVETAIVTASGDQKNPKISDNIIVWEDFRNGNWDIYMYDILNGVETQITTNDKMQRNPDVSDGIIVWEDFRNEENSDSNSDIYMYGLDEEPVPPVEVTPEARVLIEHAVQGYVSLTLGVQNGITGERLWEFTPMDGHWIDSRTVEYVFDLSLLSSALSYLPPDDENQWFVEVVTASGNEAQITEFSIKCSDGLFISTDPPVTIMDWEEAYAYIPPYTWSSIESAVAPDLIPPEMFPLIILALVVVVVIIAILIFMRKRSS